MIQLESLTKNHATAVIILFILGTTVLGSRDLGASSLLSLTAAFVLLLPFILGYSYIMKDREGTLFDVINDLFPPVFSKTVLSVFVLYAITSAVFTLRGFCEILSITSMPKTPLWFTALFIVLSACFLTRCGVVAIGKTSLGFLCVGLIYLVLTLLFCISTNTFSLDFTLPDIKAFSKTTLLFYSPLGDFVLLFFAIGNTKSKKRPYLLAVPCAFFIMLLTTLRNLLLLGENVYSTSLAPSYLATSMLSFFGVLGHLEIIESAVSLLYVLIKLSLCLIVVKNYIKTLKLNKNILYIIAIIVAFLSSGFTENITSFTTLSRYFSIVTIPLNLFLLFLLILNKKQLK